MGCGKSSVGRRLSELLCCPFMDLDHVIEERTGRTIPEIFATDGESAFRAMELETLKDIVTCQFHTHALAPTLNHTNLKESCNDVIARSEATWQSVDMVLALGGGAVMTAECAEIVHSDTICIYLKASVDTLMEHLSGQTDNRPLLSERASENEVTTRHCEESEGRRGNLHTRTRIETLMAQRSATYENTAHIIIDTDGRSVEVIASDIISSIA